MLYLTPSQSLSSQLGEITEQTRESHSKCDYSRELRAVDYLFVSPLYHSDNLLSTRQYASTVKSWVGMIGLDAALY